MKKIFSTVAALGLVAGVATTAAAVDWTVTGEYSVTGQYLSDTTNWAGGMNGVNPFENGTNAFAAHSSDAYWLHTFKIKPVMKVNDKISVFSDIRLAYDSIWGNQDDSNSMSSVTGTTGATSPAGLNILSHTHTLTSNSNNYTNNFDVHKIYMEYMSPIGMFRMGRTPAGAWEGPFLNTDGHADRIIWWPGFVPKPFSVYAFLEKQTEVEGYANNTGQVQTTDSDGDLYELNGTWTHEKARLSLAWDHYLTKTSSDPAANTGFSRDRDRIKAFGTASMGMFYGVGELSYDFGDWQAYDSNSGLHDVDLKSLAYLLAAGLKINKFDTHLAYVFAEGDGTPFTNAAAPAAGQDHTMSAAINGPAGTGLGADFNPLYIWTGKYTGAFVQNGDWVGNPVFLNSGCKVLALFGDYQLTDRMGLHGAIASGWADAPEFAKNIGLTTQTPDSHYGYEFDLGASYKLMDNLTYDLHLGYMVTGTFFDDIASEPGSSMGGQGWDTHDIYMATHSLTMSF